jgi:hypothetical protein
MSLRFFASPLVAALVASVCPGEARADLRVFESKEGFPVPATLDLYGYVQPRFSAQQQDTRPQVDFTPNPAFTIERARFGLVSSIWQRAELHFEINLAPEVAAPLDLYGVVHALVDRTVSLDLAFGQMRVPFSRQNLLSAKTYQLPDVAYFVSPTFLQDRDIGAAATVKLWDDRFRLTGHVSDGNTPGEGQTQNTDPYFLWAWRFELEPLGPTPRGEGDLRSREERHHPVVVAGGGTMFNHAGDTHYLRSYYGADVAAYWEGFSFYAELYHRTDRSDCSADPTAPSSCPTGTTPPAAVTAAGFNMQAGYFPPLPWVREHLEVEGRVERFDPDIEVTTPGADSGSRDLTQANPTWGYVGIIGGLSVFLFERGHDLKLQTSYEIRDETKRCLEGQTGNACTGYIHDNLFLLQATVGF